MLSIAAYLLPCVMCLIWSVILMMTKDKTYANKTLMALLIISAAYFYIDANFVLHEDQNYKTLVYLDKVGQFITLMMAPTMAIYLRSLRGLRSDSFKAFILFLPAFIQGTAANIIYLLIGVEKAALFIEQTDIQGGFPAAFDEPVYHLHVSICQNSYNIILFAEVLILAVYLVKTLVGAGYKFQYTASFLTGKTPANTLNTTCTLLAFLLILSGVRIVLGRDYLIHHPGVSALFSIGTGILCFCIGYLGTWFADRKFFLWDLTHPKDIPSGSLYRQMMKTSASIIETPVAEAVSKGRIEPKDALAQEFATLMKTKKPFLSPDISIEEVSRILHSNRTYVSELVNRKYNMTFRDFINFKRIEEAMKLLIDFPDEKLEILSARCGFINAAQMSKKFKELTSKTPREWQEEQRRN